jgi:hypothetical protein
VIRDILTWLKRTLKCETRAPDPQDGDPSTLSASNSTGEPQKVDLQPKVGRGSFAYVGLNSSGDLELSTTPNPGLIMLQFEVPTRSEQVRMFSNLEQSYFVTGQIRGENIVHGEVCDDENE